MKEKKPNKLSIIIFAITFLLGISFILVSFILQKQLPSPEIFQEEDAYPPICTPADPWCCENPSCFLPGTKIKTTKGLINIEDIKEGDIVFSFGANGQITTSRVAEPYSVVRSHHYEIKTKNHQVKTTNEHPFYIGNGNFKRVENLKVEDTVYILSKTGLKPETITFIQKIPGFALAYNIILSENFTYFADGFAVHNKNGGPSPSPSEEPSPSPSPSDEPSPSPPTYECTGLGPQPDNPQRGDTITFTCSGSATSTFINHFNFRVNSGASARAEGNPNQATYNFTVPETGTEFNVQCQACISADDTSCTAWGQTH